MIIGIPVYDDVDMLDVTGPYEMFSWAGIDVELIAETAGTVRFRKGFRFEVGKAFKDASRYDALWVPGGDPAALVGLMEDPKRTYLDFPVQQSTKVPLVASVCEGALLLAAAGLLDGYEATTHWAFIPCLMGRFPKVKVVDGYPRYHLDRNRLTGGGISSGLDEALKLIEMLLGTATAQDVQQSTQYYPNPPVSSEIPHISGCVLDSLPGT
jgi:transcriptional regulator GlxA family with amidase domain